MWPFDRKEREKFWEDRFQVLADYNREVSHGIMHTKEWREKMRCLQQDYDEKTKQWSESGNLYR